MDMRQWFKEAQYGMMAHWGLYSLLAGEWNGQHSSAYSEWIQANRSIPIAEYEKLAKAFNPVFFNAEEWIKLAKECGMNHMGEDIFPIISLVQERHGAIIGILKRMIKKTLVSVFVIKYILRLRKFLETMENCA